MNTKPTSTRLRGFAALSPEPAGLAPTDLAGRENTAHGRFLSGLVDRWERLKRGFAVRRGASRTRSELHRLDDRILRDIGIERGRIPDIALEVSKRRYDPWS